MQTLGGIGLGDQAGFKVESRGKIPVGMTGAGKTVNAAMFTPLYGLMDCSKGTSGESFREMIVLARSSRTLSGNAVWNRLLPPTIRFSDHLSGREAQSRVKGRSAFFMMLLLAIGHLCFDEYTVKYKGILLGLWTFHIGNHKYEHAMATVLS